MPPRPALAIFDFDGTLADSRALMLAAWDDAAGHFGFRRVDAAEIEALRQVDSRAVMRALGVPLWKLPRIAAHMRRLATAAPPPALFPGVPEVLSRVQAAGVGLAVVSSNTESNVRRALGPATAARIAYWGCNAGLFGKAARFRQVLRHSGTPAARAIGIGDELRDIAAARSLGLLAGSVAWGYATPEALTAARPDVLFSEPAAILAWFGV